MSLEEADGVIKANTTRTLEKKTKNCGKSDVFEKLNVVF